MAHLKMKIQTMSAWGKEGEVRAGDLDDGTAVFVAGERAGGREGLCRGD